jgi:glycosyltransferase involved in cell wall biosynthesis
MRIAFLSSTPPSPTEGSGTFVGVAGLVRGLRDLGHEVVFRRLALRTRFHTLDRWLYNAGVAARPPRADVVVGVDLDGFLWAGRRGRSPFVAALKGVIADERQYERGVVRLLLGIQAGWERRNARRADRVVVPSRYSAEVARAVYGVPAERIRVVPEPVDLEGWRARFATVDGRPASRPTVLAVARMYPRKRLADLLLAADVLRRRRADVQVRVVGRGPEWARVQRLHRRLGLGDHVALLGDVTARRLAVEYAGAHCFCLPTVQESFGLVFVEAMAAGLPVVACRAAAVPEVVPDGRAGLLVRPRDPSALAGALERVLGDERLRRAYGEVGRQHAERYALPRVVREFLQALPA